MPQPAKMPQVWELLKNFKDLCSRQGWKTSDYEDLVKMDGEYHDFIGTRTIHPSTFRRIAFNKRRAVPDGKSYRNVDISFTAWVFQQQPSEQLIETLAVDQELSKKTALYDLSGAYQGKPLCLKLNETNSPVFDQFEKFLKETYGVTFKPLRPRLYEPQTNEPKTFKSKLLKTSTG